jgi:hypothetical protein
MRERKKERRQGTLEKNANGPMYRAYARAPVFTAQCDTGTAHFGALMVKNSFSISENSRRKTAHSARLLCLYTPFAYRFHTLSLMCIA